MTAVRASALLLAILLALPVASAASYPNPREAPRYFDSACIQAYDRRFVYDFVGLVTPEWGALIEGAACEVYTNTSAHFVLAAVPDTGDESLESYALHLFETWGIGAKDKNDGILLLYVDHYNLSGKSSALRLEVGYGLEGTINGHVSANAIRLMQETKRQALDAGDDEVVAKNLAIASGVDYVLTTMSDDYQDGRFPAPQDLASSGPPLWFWIVVIVVVLALLQAIGRSAHGSRGWGYRTGSSGAWQGALAGSFARGGGGWGGGGGFGGGGFGGGRSGGGGGSGGF